MTLLGNNATVAAIVGSAIGATLAFLLNSWRNRRFERRQQTFLLLSRIFEQGPVADARIQFARWVVEGREFEDDDVSEEDDKTILYMIDFFEFVCEGAMARKTIDIKLLDQESGGRIARYYPIIKDYVKARGERLTAANNGEAVILYRHVKRFLAERKKITV